MKQIFLIFILFTSSLIFAQQKESDKILEEGKLLYRLEKGSWYGTDHFLANFADKKDSIGGYLSYETEDHKINNVFFNRFNKNKVLVRYQFDSIPKSIPIQLDTINTKVTDIENSLRTILNDARTKAQDNSDKFFSFYENASLNFIPLINKKERKVLVLTGPKVSGVVVLGNDYQLNYNKKNKFKDKFKIHNTILQFPYKSEDETKPTVSTVHTHVNSEFISSTDVCTLLLYKDYVEWNQHIVISDKYVSIFDLEKELLAVMTKKAWDKMNNYQKE